MQNLAIRLAFGKRQILVRGMNLIAGVLEQRTSSLKFRVLVWHFKSRESFMVIVQGLLFIGAMDRCMALSQSLL